MGAGGRRFESGRPDVGREAPATTFTLARVSEAPFHIEPAAHRRPGLGYAMAAAAAALWAVNGTVSKVILASGVSSLRLTEVRCTGAFLGLVLILAVTGPARLRVPLTRAAVPARLRDRAGSRSCSGSTSSRSTGSRSGSRCSIQYLAPLLVALWARYVFHEPVRRRIWLALALALGGLALIVDVRRGGTVSTAGILFALAAAATYMLYILLAEHAVGDRGAVSLLAWGFGFAALFFAMIAPWWSFPGHRVSANVSLLGHLSTRHLPVWALMTWMVVLGTIVPFFLLVSALRHLPATRVGIIAMLEPVIATIVAWLWLGESLGVDPARRRDRRSRRRSCSPRPPVETQATAFPLQDWFYDLQRWVARPISTAAERGYRLSCTGRCEPLDGDLSPKRRAFNRESPSRRPPERRALSALLLEPQTVSLDSL